MSSRLLWIALVGSSLLQARGAIAGEGRVFDDAARDFFGFTTVHSVHLILTPEQWDAMEPRRRPGAGFPGAPGAGGPPGGGGARGPGMDLGAAFEAGQAQRPGVAALMGIEFDFVNATVEIDGERVENIGLRYKGNGTYMMSQTNDKRPFKVDFNRFDKSKRFRGLTSLNLHNNVFDPTFMHEVLGYAVSREAGLPAPRTALGRVHVTVSGRHEKAFLGIYTITEQVNDEFLKNWFGTTKGLLMKPGSRDSLKYRGDTWKAHERPLNVQENGSEAERTRMVEFLKLLELGSDEELAARLGDYVDLDNLALFLALNVAPSNLDSVLTLGQNYYLYVEPRSGRLHGWLWDLDLSWGFFPMIGTAEERLNLSINEPWQEGNRPMERLFGVPALRERYRAELRRLIDGPLAPAAVRQRIETLAAGLRPLVAEEGPETARRFENSVFGTNSTSIATGTKSDAPRPNAQPDFSRFENQNVPLVAFVERRARSIEDQLAGRSEGARLTFAAFGGPGPGPGGPRGGGGGRPPRPEMFIAGPFLRDGDADQSGDLNGGELTQLGEKWFAGWDNTSKGNLSQEDIVAGINRSFGPPGGARTSQRLRPAPNLGGGMMFQGPGAFLAPALMKACDTNRDGKLTAGETKETFTRWTTEWDADRDGKLVVEEIGKGFGSHMTPPGQDRPPGPPAEAR